MDCCPVQCGASSDIASCNCHVVNCKVGLGVKFEVESTMVARDETNLDLGTTSSRTCEISISNSSNRLYQLDFSTIDTYLQLFNFSKSVNV